MDLNSVTPEAGKLENSDLQQLSHYIRHLQALGLAPDELWAGIIGRDIESAFFMQMGSVINGRGKSATSVLGDHDAAFAIALDVVKRSREENENPSKQTGITPQNWSDATFGCPGCPFKSTCLQEMKDFDNGNGHVTLLATITPDVAASKLPGITSIRQLREATPTDDFMVKAQLRAHVWKSKRAQLLDPSTPLDLPTFDIEIDIDLENSMEALRDLAPDEVGEDDRLYLYGFGVHDRTANPDWHSATIETISDYSNTEEGEYRVMLDTWQRLHKEIADAESANKSIGIFHYSHHEKIWWENFAKKHDGKPGVPSLGEVQDFVGKYLVDLLTYTRKIALPTMGYSIKQVAPWAGFEWSVKDPGGAGSLLKYRDATNPELDQATRDAAIAWLDSYNRDDVRATFAVRNYIRSLNL